MLKLQNIDGSTRTVLVSIVNVSISPSTTRRNVKSFRLILQNISSVWDRRGKKCIYYAGLTALCFLLPC